MLEVKTVRFAKNTLCFGALTQLMERLITKKTRRGI